MNYLKRLFFMIIAVYLTANMVTATFQSKERSGGKLVLTMNANGGLVHPSAEAKEKGNKEIKAEAKKPEPAPTPVEAKKAENAATTAEAKKPEPAPTPAEAKKEENKEIKAEAKKPEPAPTPATDKIAETTVLGRSSCLYFGATKKWCELDPVSVQDLPNECTSFLYYDVKVFDNFKVSDGTEVETNEVYLKHIIESGKPSFLYYSHAEKKDWLTAMQSKIDVKTEMENLKTYLQSFPGLSGLIVEDIKYMSNSNTKVTSLYNSNINDLTNIFKRYLDEIRLNFPDYKIGVSFIGSEFIYNKIPLQYNLLDSSIDFYVFNLYDFNNCSTDLLNGTTPIVTPQEDPEEKVIFSLESLVKKMNILAVPLSKSHLQYYLGAKKESPTTHFCDLTIKKRCNNAIPSPICADRYDTFVEKGKFIREKGLAGFIAMDLDLFDDADGLSCKCDGKYRTFPAFRYIYEGLTSKDNEIPSCTLLSDNGK